MKKYKYLFNFKYFFYNLTLFLVHGIVIAPIEVLSFLKQVLVFKVKNTTFQKKKT
jgi:hypothetical protein